MDLVETEAERLSFPHELQLVHCSNRIHAIPSRIARRSREEPAPFVVTNRIRFHFRELCELSYQQRLARLFSHSLSDAACSRVTAPSNAILPSTTTVGIERTP